MLVYQRVSPIDSPSGGFPVEKWGNPHQRLSKSMAYCPLDMSTVKFLLAPTVKSPFSSTSIAKYLSLFSPALTSLVKTSEGRWLWV